MKNQTYQFRYNLKLTVFLLFVFCGTVVYGQEDLKFWDQHSPIEYSDYRLKERPKTIGPKGVASTRCGEIYRYKRAGNDSSVYVFEFEVKAVMYRNGSWADPVSRTPYLLKHERLHFDISEFFARQLLAAFNKGAYSNNFQAEIREIRQGLRVKENAMQNLYDVQAQHGLKEEMQYKWEAYIGELLAGNYSLEEALKKQPVVGKDGIINRGSPVTEAQRKLLVAELNAIEKKYGFLSQPKFLVKLDSGDLDKVSSMLDQYGWLGADKVGPNESTTLFFVIINADLKTQLKYLPLLRDAVIQKKAHPSHFAVLEDRTAVRRGINQIYGSQIIQNIKTGKIYVLPIEDPENVDKWRAKALMPPMKSFLGQYGIDWSLDQYYHDLKKFRIVKPGQYEFLE